MDDTWREHLKAEYTAWGSSDFRTQAMKLPPAFIDRIRVYADAEDIRPSTIIAEGILRALYAREEDPAYMAALPEPGKYVLAKLSQYLGEQAIRLDETSVQSGDQADSLRELQRRLDPPDEPPGGALVPA